VVSTERNQVVEVGSSAVLPPVDVVGLGDRHVSCATGDGARSVHRTQRASLSGAGVSSTTAVVEPDRASE
jgi:hypothetical protein